MNPKDMIVHRGGCHCGRVRFEVEAPRDVEVQSCTARCAA